MHFFVGSIFVRMLVLRLCIYIYIRRHLSRVSCMECIISHPRVKEKWKMTSEIFGNINKYFLINQWIFHFSTDGRIGWMDEQTNETEDSPDYQSCRANKIMLQEARCSVVYDILRYVETVEFLITSTFRIALLIFNNVI